MFQRGAMFRWQLIIEMEDDRGIVLPFAIYAISDSTLEIIKDTLMLSDKVLRCALFEQDSPSPVKEWRK